MPNSFNLLFNGNLDLKKVKKIVSKELGELKPTLYTMQVGVVKPNMRAEVMRILGEVRQTIAAILVVVIVFITLLFDHAALFAALKIWLRNHRHLRGEHKFNLAGLYPYFYGAISGGVLTGGMLLLTGARLPLLSLRISFVCGAFLGLLISLFAESLSPVNEAELIAAEAMGLSWLEIIRQIVIPSGRPSLAQLLNKRKVLFP